MTARKSGNATSDAGTAAPSTTPADLGQAEVQAAADAAAEKGYFGTVPDDTPNEHYTLAGVIAGKPTPETTRGQ